MRTSRGRPSSRTAFAFLLILAPAAAAAHPQSVSSAQIAIQAHAVDLVIRLPLDDVDLLLRLDRDLDGRVTPAELESSRAVLAAYLVEHAHVVADGRELTPAIGRLALWRDPTGFDYLEAAMRAEARGALHVVSMRADFLTDLYPAHAMQARIVAAGREERFVFTRGATYERRLADARGTAAALVAAAAAVLALLWFARRHRRPLAPALAILLIASAAHADVIMTAAGLNGALKTMERLGQDAAGGPSARRADALFRLGAQADALASLMNDEVASHGMEQRELIDLALSRTRALGVVIAYDRDKKAFFYDGEAFRQYLKLSPRGAHAAEAEFTLIAYQFYQSPGTEPQQLLASADTKQRFLARYPAFKANAELSLYLAIDYRDLYRHYRGANETATAEKYRLLTRAAYQRIVRRYPGTEQASSARQLLRRFDEETHRTPRNGGSS